MPSAQRTITINKPMDEVFAYFADVKNNPEWRGRDHVREISVEGEMRQGTRVRQKLALGPFGAPVKADMDVVVYQPPTELAFQVTTGLLRPRVAFAFAPDGDATAVTFSLDAALSGLKKFLMSSMVRKNMDEAMAALDEAKRLIEA